MVKPTRYFGLDIHKFFMVAVAVDAEKQIVYGPRRVEWQDFERWIEREITTTDAVAIEMTTNTWEVYDLLTPKAFNVLVVHPQHVKAIVEAQVKTDKKAAQTLAELLAAGMLHGIWVPEACLKELAAKDPRMPLLIQITGIGFLTAITILAAIGEIERFPSAKKLVGYAGLGSRVHDSGMAYSTGRITKAGRRDLRRAMVDASNHAITDHAHWKAQFEALSSHIGKKKAIVAIARKLLVVVWHVLTKEAADRFANPTQVACSMFAFAHKVRVKNLPKGQTALGFTRNQLDRLKIGQEVQKIPWGTKTFKLPESKLTEK